MALESLGERQQQLLRHLLQFPDGLTVDELSKALSISRNAVNQHIATLESAGLIGSSIQPQARGRPFRRYSLSANGREMFPRQYALFATMLSQLVKKRVGAGKFERAMRDLGREIADDYMTRVNSFSDPVARLNEIATILDELGYEAATDTAQGEQAKIEKAVPEIIARNCVFHQLAETNDDVCQLDLALIEELLGEPIELKECIVKGGKCCRFGIKRES